MVVKLIIFFCLLLACSQAKMAESPKAEQVIKVKKPGRQVKYYKNNIVFIELVKFMQYMKQYMKKILFRMSSEMCRYVKSVVVKLLL